jgi:hypothetical protein
MTPNTNAGLAPGVGNITRQCDFIGDSPDEQMCSGYGQFHTDEADQRKPNKKRTRYTNITFSEILQLAIHPQRVPKTQAQWVIPSMLASRTFKKQEAEGMFVALWADLDKEPPSLDKLVGLMEDFDFVAYTSRSATKAIPKCRIIIPLSEPLPGVDWVICQEILNDKLTNRGITPDAANLRPAQLCYLPNRGQFYDYRSRCNGSTLDPMNDWVNEVAVKKQTQVDKDAAMARLTQAAKERRAVLSISDSPDLIGAFNRAYSVPELLIRARYDQKGDTFRHPASESGSFSASVKDGRVHSLSTADPLYTGGGGIGAHDAFSVFTVLWAGGDRDNALEIAGDDWLTIDGESWNVVRQRKYQQGQQTKSHIKPLETGTDVADCFDDLVLNSEDVQKMSEAEFLIPNMIVRGHVAAYVSPGNGGKTTIFIYLSERLAAIGMKVLYINVDGSPGDLKRHYAHAANHGYKVVAPDAKTGKSTDDVLAIFKSIASGSASCRDLVFIIDTLKKFLDVINKKEAKEFYKLLRAITVKGATICLLGHTNKYKGEDGKHVFEGTADLRNDLDELIYLDSDLNLAGDQLEVTTRPDKVRAEFAPKSFVIHLPDRTVTEPLSVFNILAKDERELLELIKGAVAEGHHSQKEIIAAVKPKTAHGDKKIRATLLRHSHGSYSEIKVENAGRGKDLYYSLRANPLAVLGALKGAMG